MKNILKSKKVITIITLFAIILITLLFVFLTHDKDEDTINKSDNPNQNITNKDDIIIDLNNHDKQLAIGKVDIVNVSVNSEKKDVSNIVLTLENSMPEKVDLRKDYKLYVYNTKDDVLTIIDGTALGIVDAKDRLICDIKLDYDKSTIGRVIIKKQT